MLEAINHTKLHTLYFDGLFSCPMEYKWVNQMMDRGAARVATLSKYNYYSIYLLGIA